MLLTIAIPTYKRPELLHKNLIHIFRQIAGRHEVAVFIADDSDGVENGHWIAEASAQFPDAQISCIVNSKNLGIDENIKHCIRTPQSDYIWLLGEDDLLTDGAVDKVLNVLTSCQPIFLFANYIYCDDGHTRFADRPVLDELAPSRLIDFDDFAASSIWALGFIGGCVIRAESWRQQAVEKFSETYYSHVGGIIDSCIGCQIYVVNDILVLNRAEDINTFTWSRSTFEVYFSFYDMLRNSRLAEQPALLRQSERAASRLFAVFSLSWLAAKRADGVFDLEAYRKHYRHRVELSRGWRLGALMLAVIPRGPLRLLRWAHLQRRFRRKTL